jgi:hypothetical protein
MLNTLKDIFKKSYLEHDNLADATRYLANAFTTRTSNFRCR